MRDDDAALMFVVPVKVFAPLRVKVPVPDFVSPPLPPMMPEKVVEESSPPAVSVPLPSVTLPAPASEPMAALKLFRSKTAPTPTLTLSAEADGIPVAVPSRSVPPLIVVAPA